MSPPTKITKSTVLSEEKKKALFSIFKTKKPKIKLFQNKDLKKRLDMFIPEFKKSTQFLKENPEEAKKLYMDDVHDCENVVEMNIELLDKSSFDHFLLKTENIGKKEISFSVDKTSLVKPSIEIIESD